MELKRLKRVMNLALQNLLIVPYGIETELMLLTCDTEGLLIVPYGIETIRPFHEELSTSAF